MSPSRRVLEVGLELHMSTFFGCEVALFPDVHSIDNYIGTVCHGHCFPFSAKERPHEWAQGPSLIAGKVNVSHRASAFGLGQGDKLLLYCGEYTLYRCNAGKVDKTEDSGALVISENSAGEPEIMMDGLPFTEWTFTNNTLKWSNKGEQMLLHFSKQWNSISVQGRVDFQGRGGADGVNAIGELNGEISGIPPQQLYDTTMSRNTAMNMNITATMLLERMLDVALRTFSGDCSDKALDATSAAELGRYVLALETLETQIAEFEKVFVPNLKKETLTRALQYNKLECEMAGLDAWSAQSINQEIVEALERAKQEWVGAESDSKTARAANCAYRSSQAIWRASQAAQKAFEIQVLAAGAAKHAENTPSHMTGLATKDAAQCYNKARSQTHEAACFALKAAQAAKLAVTGGIQNLARASNFHKLKDIAEASEIADKVVAAAKKAADGWAEGAALVGQGSLDASYEAYELAQQCFKIMRRMEQETTAQSEED